MSLSTHVLDTTAGRPAAGIRVTLERQGVVVGSDLTDEEGRIREFRTTGALLDPANYRLKFAVAEYWKAAGKESFYPEIVIAFTITTDKGHYHVPLLLSPFGYTTYRGS
jgi:5-hydroxyisourate hydrolase